MRNFQLKIKSIIILIGTVLISINNLIILKNNLIQHEDLTIFIWSWVGTIIAFSICSVIFVNCVLKLLTKPLSSIIDNTGGYSDVNNEKMRYLEEGRRNSDDKFSKKIFAGPEVLTKGFIYVKDNVEIIEEARKICLEVIKENTKPRFIDFNKIKIGIRDKLGKYLYKETECKPMILVVMQEVERDNSKAKSLTA